MWPTPRMEGFDAGAHRGNPDSLHSAVKLLPTPQAFDATGIQRSPEALARAKTKGGCANLRETVNGKLHGRWTLKLMGYPSDWCDDLPPDPLGTRT